MSRRVQAKAIVESVEENSPGPHIVRVKFQEYNGRYAAGEATIEVQDEDRLLWKSRQARDAEVLLDFRCDAVHIDDFVTFENPREIECVREYDVHQ